MQPHNQASWYVGRRGAFGFITVCNQRCENRSWWEEQNTIYCLDCDDHFNTEKYVKSQLPLEHSHFILFKLYLLQITTFF